jgi:hypothetical protein
MAYKAMSNPSVIINNEAIAIVPNSLVWKKGHGEVNQRVASTGGDAVEFVLSEDVSTKVGVVQFKLYTTKRNIDFIDVWKILSKTGAIAITINDGDFVQDFIEMVMCNDPDINASADGEIDIEMKGRGLV